MMSNYIGIFQGFKVESIPNKDFKSPIIIPECMVEYLEKAEKLREEYNGLLIKQLFNLEEKKVSEQKYNKDQLLEDMITEYFNRHPDAGLAWWQLPLEQQPEGFKAEMYDILWTIFDKDKFSFWNNMTDEWCKRHPSGGLTWWNLPLEEQPVEFKTEMYDIFWTILNEEK